jgi:hypothetical protein
LNHFSGVPFVIIISTYYYYYCYYYYYYYFVLGINTRKLASEAIKHGLQNSEAVNEIVKKFLDQKKIKEVAHSKKANQKFYFMVDIIPDESITGDIWHEGPKVDTVFIKSLEYYLSSILSETNKTPLSEIHQTITKSTSFDYKCIDPKDFIDINALRSRARSKSRNSTTTTTTTSYARNTATSSTNTPLTESNTSKSNPINPTKLIKSEKDANSEGKTKSNEDKSTDKNADKNTDKNTDKNASEVLDNTKLQIWNELLSKEPSLKHASQLNQIGLLNDIEKKLKSIVVKVSKLKEVDVERILGNMIDGGQVLCKQSLFWKRQKPFTSPYGDAPCSNCPEWMDCHSHSNLNPLM